MEFIKDTFSDDEVLLMYRCGSYAFDTSDEKSDDDYVVVLKNLKGYTHLGNGKREYFVFGLSDWRKKMEFSDCYSDYYEIFNDEIIAFPNSVVYMDDSIKSDVDKYREGFPSKIKVWLGKVYSYFNFYYKLGDSSKGMYHLIRIRYLVSNYKETGSFSLNLTDDVAKLIRDYKRSETREKYRPEIREALDFIYKEAYANERD